MMNLKNEHACASSKLSWLEIIEERRADHEMKASIMYKTVNNLAPVDCVIYFKRLTKLDCDYNLTDFSASVEFISQCQKQNCYKTKFLL